MTPNVNYRKTKEAYEAQIRSGRIFLLVIAILTAVNIVFTLFGQDFYFLLSAFVPYYLVMYFSLNCGILSEGAYQSLWGEDFVKSDYIFLDKSLFAIAMVVALVVLAVIVFCWYFSKKWRNCFLVGAVLLAVDLVGLFVLLAQWGLAPEFGDFFGAFFHVFAIWQLITAFRAVNLAKTAPTLAEMRGGVAYAPIMEEENLNGDNGRADNGRNAMDAGWQEPVDPPTETPADITPAETPVEPPAEKTDTAAEPSAEDSADPSGDPR